MIPIACVILLLSGPAILTAAAPRSTRSLYLAQSRANPSRWILNISPPLLQQIQNAHHLLPMQARSCVRDLRVDKRVAKAAFGIEVPDLAAKLLVETRME